MLCVFGASIFDGWVEAESCDYATGGTEGIPYVAQVMTGALPGEVCVGIAFVAVDSPLCLDADCDDAGKVEWIGRICSASVNTIRRRGYELSGIRIGAKEVDRGIDMMEVGG